MLLMALLGFVRGWWRGGPSGKARIWYERVVLATLAIMLAVNWADEQGNPWWSLSVLFTLPIAPALGLMLPYSLGVVTAATIREGADKWRPIVRVGLILALVPIGHVTIYHSGIWPSRKSADHMTVVFHRHRAVFDRIAAKYEAALPPECQPICPSNRIPPRPSNTGLLLLHALLSTDAGYWRLDGTLYLNWWDVGAFDRVHSGFVYSPRDAPLPWRATYQPLGGDWYLMTCASW